MDVIRCYRTIILLGSGYNEATANFDMTVARIDKAGAVRIKENDSIIVYEIPDSDSPNEMAIITFSNPQSRGAIHNIVSDSMV